ncbi:hypothetical protein [Methylosinus sp. LW4]|uniref:hypothetical protein n=1 Tax=Methylosinus sp. LW4 TaxID=136993 RepID=UPI000381328B|nr:hypothetical protein [Methylosinus sp. LW4]
MRYAKIIAICVALSATAAAGEEAMVLGPRQFEADRSGAGAVLCAWSIYLTVQHYANACGVARSAADDAIDEAIKSIDEFILANSSLHPTRASLEAFKRRAAQSEAASARKFCENRDLEPFRSVTPQALRESVKKLLAVPREPVMNPCL